MRKLLPSLVLTAALATCENRIPGEERINFPEEELDRDDLSFSYRQDLYDKIDKYGDRCRRAVGYPEDIWDDEGVTQRCDSNFFVADPTSTEWVETSNLFARRCFERGGIFAAQDVAPDMIDLLCGDMERKGDIPAYPLRTVPPSTVITHMLRTCSSIRNLGVAGITIGIGENGLLQTKCVPDRVITAIAKTPPSGVTSPETVKK